MKDTEWVSTEFGTSVATAQREAHISFSFSCVYVRYYIYFDIDIELHILRRNCKSKDVWQTRNNSI